MKTNKLMLLLVTAVLFVGAAGCNKDSAPQQDMNKAATDAADAAKNAAEAVKEGGKKVAQDVKQAGEAVATDVEKKTEELVAPVNAKAQEIIDGAKKLFNEGKLEQSLAKLKELGSEKLSAEQQTLTDHLTARINKLLGTAKPGAIKPPGTQQE